MPSSPDDVTNRPPSAWGERTQLATFLDYTRAKCEDVSAENAVKAPLPGSPLMTLAGLINHSAGSSTGRLRVAVDVPLDDVLREWAEQPAG